MSALFTTLCAGAILTAMLVVLAVRLSARNRAQVGHVQHRIVGGRNVTQIRRHDGGVEIVEVK